MSRIASASVKRGMDDRERETNNSRVEQLQPRSAKMGESPFHRVLSSPDMSDVELS